MSFAAYQLLREPRTVRILLMHPLLLSASLQSREEMPSATYGGHMETLSLELKLISER